MDLLTCMLLWISVLLSGPSGARAFMLPDIGEPEFIRRCVQAHNVHRSRAQPPAANMRSMSWDDALARGARSWARHCRASHNPVLKQEGKAHPEFRHVGENIWLGAPYSAFTVESAVNSWNKEGADYTLANNSCARLCGHYTQSWDDALARGARSWARHCRASHNPVLKQEGKAHPEFRHVGENIWLGAPYSAFTVESAVNSWNKEGADYTLANNSCARLCGHYTQLMWATSYKVGCAVHVCSRGIENFSKHPESTIFVCNYGDAGNVFGFTPYIVGLACSKCGMEKCRDKLCRYDWVPGWDLGPSGSAQAVSDWLNGSKLQLLAGSFWLLYFYAMH
ncbi:hypothetical protein PGIGA_G00229730 [Pangasianodon gigas]|uniref:Uncharacterized protein n=1 Tax=Pangasianodon gigas TaxID=30993 RepID=A0ACC5WLK1_PANGG|nr:hypothetical protein [Pangasianodon gigas]